MYAIEAQNTVKQYKNGTLALKGLNLSVNTGEIFTLLGHNGAGKSTLIKILTTYLKPTSGQVIMLGKDIRRHSGQVRSEIACVAQHTSIDTCLSLEENMMFQSRLYKIPKDAAKKKMETLIADFGLEQYRKRPVSSYSGGVKRRLDIALNMMPEPKILFLDEPTVGMDIESRMSMWDMIKKIRENFGTTIFLTTHYLEEADHLSDSVCIMKEGKDVIQGTPYKLRSLFRQDSLQIQFSDKTQAQKYLLPLKDHFMEETLFTRNTAVVIHTQDSASHMKRAVRLLLDQSIPFTGVQIVQPTLEDIFLRLTAKNYQEV